MLNLLRAARAQTGDEAGAEGVDPQQSNAAVLSDLYRRYAQPIYRYVYSRTVRNHLKEK